MHVQSYTHLILALGIIREPTVWGLLLHNILAYIHAIGLPKNVPLFQGDAVFELGKGEGSIAQLRIRW